VDDGEENRELLTLVLKEVGVDVETADNGKRAVDLAIAQPFDVILLDMQMPIMDGYTAARALRDQGYERPIIALTANAMMGDEDKCLDAGCSGFLPKPIDMDRLFQTLAEVLGHEQSTQRPITPVGQPSETDTDGGSVTGDSTAIDGSPLVSTLPTHKPQFATIVKKFVVRLDEQLRAMEATLESHDLEALAKLAHWLKGSGGSVGFDVFTEPARQLEQLAKGDDRDGAAAMVAQLRGLAARIVVEEGAAAEVSL
jgi:CheY-like chemotaxis protein/HPt (histidine-containing phosphotransfer) domain-containing protein